MMYAFIHRPRVPEGTQQPVSISRTEGLMLSSTALKKRIDSRLRPLDPSCDGNQMTKGADDFRTIDDSRILKTQTTCRTHQPNCQRTKRTRPRPLTVCQRHLPVGRERVRKRKVMLASAERLSTPATEIFLFPARLTACAKNLGKNSRFRRARLARGSRVETHIRLFSRVSL